MISMLREFTKSWIFKGLMVLLVLSFAVFGLNNVFSPSISTDVVTAGERKISSREFKTRYDNFKQQYEQQGQSFTNDEFVAAGQHTRMLNELADQAAFSAWLDSRGVKASAKLLLDEIAKIPAFFNSVTGRFDQDTYTQALASAQMTVQDFEADQRDQIAVNQYLSAALAGLKAPRVFAAADSAFSLQNRDASLFVLSPMNVANPAPPTEAEIEAFYKANQQKWQIPELRTAAVVMFSAADYTNGIAVDEAELRKLYDFRRDTLATPETRSFVQVTAPNMSAAAKISADLKAGKSAEEAARANKGEVITYSVKPKTAVSDVKVADAAFKMQPGEVSGAIQGDLAISVVKMGDINIGSIPSFENVRPRLEQEYRADKAADKLNEVTNAFSDAINKGEDFEATARRLNLRISALEPMTAEGKTGREGVDYSTYGPIVKGVFDLQQVGSASDVESIGEGQYFAIKLLAVKPAGAPPLAEIRNDLGRMYMMEKMQDAINAEAEKAMDRLTKGESFTAVVASYKAQVQPLKGVNRQTAQQTQMPQQLMGRIFMAKPGETFQAQGQALSVAIGRLDAVHQGDPANANSLSATVRPRLTQMVAQDITMAARSSARAAVKTATYPDAALRELGVTPPASSSDQSGAAKAKS